MGEGVETQDQNDFLAEHGCELGQVYLVSKPGSAAAIGDFLSQRAKAF